MKIYANLDELIPHLGEIDGWLYVDEDRWAQNPATAEIYLFAEEEVEYRDTHADGEDFDDARPPYIPAQLVDRPIGILLESGTLYDVLWNLAKYVPDYTTEQLAHAVSFYQENDTFYEACGLTLAFHVWATWAERKDAWRLKERKAELDKALQQPLGEIWVASNHLVPAAELATQYGETQFATPEEAARFAQACAEKLQGRDINAVYLLAEAAAPNAARTNVKDMVYLGAFAVRTGNGGTPFDA